MQLLWPWRGAAGADTRWTGGDWAAGGGGFAVGGGEGIWPEWAEGHGWTAGGGHTIGGGADGHWTGEITEQLADVDLIVMAERQDEFVISVLGEVKCCYQFQPLESDRMSAMLAL